jgi:formiminotetrahydrofolate cyclodeaminase
VVTAEFARHGSAYVKKLARSDFGTFWKVFSQALREDQNVPWDQIERAQFQPEFVGIALSLIRGNAGAREAFRSYFAALDLPESAYEDEAQVKEKIFRVALEAAHKAPADDREASLATELRIEESLRSASADVKAHTSDLADDVVDQLKKQWAASFSNERLEEQVEIGFAREKESQRQHAEAQRQQFDELKSQVERIERLVGSNDVGETSGEASDDSDEKSLTVEPNDQESVEGLLRELEIENKDGATLLRRIYGAKGPAGIIGFLRENQCERSTAVLDAAANIAALDGFFWEAESAQLEAAKKAQRPDEEAKHLIRAAGMAQIQGAEQRFQTHLGHARRLAPDLPAVRIAVARASGDGGEMVRQLDGVDPESEKQRAIVHVTRAQGWLLQGESGKAADELQKAEATGVNSLPVREMRAMVAWVKAKEAMRDGKELDTASLLKGAEEFEAVARTVAKQRRVNEAAALTARAAEAYGLAEEIEKAARLLESVEQPETLLIETRESLAEAAIFARRPDLVRRFLDSPFEVGSSSSALWADAVLLEEEADPGTREKAVQILLPLLESGDQDLRDRAAFALLSGAATSEEVEWNEAAAEIVRERMPAAEASMKAQVLQRERQYEDAENVLLPFAVDGKILRQLRDLAAAREDWQKVRDRSAQLSDAGGKPVDRLAQADATFRAGDPEQAKEMFLGVARSQGVEEHLRGAGYGGAIEIAGAARDYEEIRRLAQEWHEELPSDSNAVWNLLFGLARVAQHQAAHELFRREEPDPDTEQRASLLAEVLGRSAPKGEALRQIANLSDRYGRQVEALEGFFLKVSLEAEQSGEVPAELEDRIRNAWATFPERFPDQEFMQVVKAPSTLEGFEELLREMGGGNNARIQQETIEEISAGERPVNGLAAAAPHGSIGRCWMGLGFLPLGFCIEHIDELEANAASKAIGGAAIWDSSSLFVVGGLGGRDTETVLGLFPGSRIASETLEDADAALESLPAQGAHETVQDPETGALIGIREHTKESIDRLHAMSAGMLKMARDFLVAPGLGSKSDPEMRNSYEKAERRPWRAVVASLALAQRLELPLYSDDRWIRRAARGLGIESFGTLALMDALWERGVLSSSERRMVRQRLLATGAWGVAPDGDELIAYAEDSGWLLSKPMRGGLNDRAAWRAKPANYMRSVARFLGALYRQRPELLGAWIKEAIAGFNHALPEIDRRQASQYLLLLSWDLENDLDVSRACFQAIVEEVRSLPGSLRHPSPALLALSELMESVDDEPERFRFLMFMRLISRLKIDDAVSAYCQVVEPGKPLGAEQA